MITRKEAADRLRLIARERLEPLVYLARLPMQISVWQGGPAPSLAEALLAPYRPVQTGWRWGPVWSTAWFRLRATLPDGLDASVMTLRFSCGTEATLWSGDHSIHAPRVPVHGLDVNHQCVPAPALTQALRHGSGNNIELFIEAACNRPHGATTFFWDDPAEVARWKEPLPGRIECAELVRIDERVRRTIAALNFAAGVLVLGRADEPLPTRELDSLSQIESLSEHATCPDHPRAIDTMAMQALGLASAAGVPARARSVCHAIGHAHIDTAWLWRLSETRRKCLRTFSTALRLIESNPDFRFVCTQPQQYAWVERDSPALFEQIRARVQQGRWEIGAALTHAQGAPGRVASGAMWIEPDCNIPSGESLIRQFLHGTRYVQDRFAVTSSHPFVFLPDTFGFPASLPQILAGCGVRTFIFNKLWWNESNPPTMSAFRWRGIDGSEIVSYLTPGMEYNATMTPAELRKGDDTHRSTDPTAPHQWLQPFGYGDGGGGPTQEMIDIASLAEPIDSLPRIRFGRIDEFCQHLHTRINDARRDGKELPIWPEAELYLERHRGTYTAQAWIKRANRHAEEDLRVAELLVCAAGSPSVGPARADSGQTLDRAWKLLLLNQFHDILPGSSIKDVYDDAREQFGEIGQLAREVIAAALPGAPASPLAAPHAVPDEYIVINPASQARSQVVTLNGECHFIPLLAANGLRRWRPGESDKSPRPRHVSVTRTADAGVWLANGLVECRVDGDGSIGSLRSLTSAAPALLGPLNVLSLYRDEPKYWEAWDIDRDYLDHPLPLGPVDAIEVSRVHPLRAEVRVSRPLGSQSRITQWITLDAGSPRVDVLTHATWREARTLLRAQFHSGIRAEHATCGIQFGHLQRSTSRADPISAARFEFCAHRWIDLSGMIRSPGAHGNDSDARSSGPGRAGLAILSESKYGHSCAADTIGLTLLRSTRFPDESADIGEHEFTYSLLPHAGDWRAANADAEAEALNRPLRLLPIQPGADRSLPRQPEGTPAPDWTPFTIDATQCGGHVEVSALKPAEDGDGLIVRLVETRGVGGKLSVHWRLPLRSIEFADLLEQPAATGPLHTSLGLRTTEIELRPFQIATFRLRLK